MISLYLECYVMFITNVMFITKTVLM